MSATAAAAAAAVTAAEHPAGYILAVNISDERVALFVDGQEVTGDLTEECSNLDVEGYSRWRDIVAEFVLECFSHQMSLSDKFPWDREALKTSLLYLTTPDVVECMAEFSLEELYWGCFHTIAFSGLLYPNPLAGRLKPISKFFQRDTNARLHFVPSFVPGFLAECLQEESLTRDSVKGLFDQKISQSAPPSTSSSPLIVIYPESLRKGFNDPYQPLTTSEMSPKDMLLAHINTCKDLVIQRRAFYSLTCPIVQSSGAGKTRLALECHHDFFLIYICFRQEPVMVPPRTPIAADFFMKLLQNNNTNTQRAIAIFFCALFDTIASESFVRKIHDRAAQTMQVWASNANPAVTVEWVHALRVCFHKEINNLSVESNSQRDFWSSVESHYNDTITRDQQAWDSLAPSDLYKELSSRMRNALGCLERTDAPQSSFLFVLDEVRYLFPDVNPRGPTDIAESPSLFASLRSVTHSAVTHDWFFLLLETTSKATNFSPVRTAGNEIVSSHRQRGLDLLPTFYCFPFTGPWTIGQSVLEKCAQTTTIFQSVDGLQTFSYNFALDLLAHSRPMYLVGAHEDNIVGLIRFALAKFFGELTYDRSRRPDLHTAQMNALLCYCYGLKPTALEIKEKLISDHAATLELFESTRRTFDMVVGYLPEPMLGEAAAWAMREHNKEFSFLNRLQHLLLAQSQGQLARAHSSGDRGEFAATVYMLEIMRRTTENLKNPFASSPLPVHKLLSTMMNGAEVDRVLDSLSTTTVEDRARAYVWRHCLHALINFTAVHESRSVLSEKNLRNAIASHVGWLAVPGEQGIDLVFGATRREDAEDKRGEADEFHRVALFFQKKAELWKCQRNISNLRAKLSKSGCKKKGELQQTLDMELQKKLRLDAEISSDQATLSDPSCKKPRTEGHRPRPVAVAVQVKNELSKSHLSKAIGIHRNQSRHALDSGSCEMVVSILIYVGAGSFTSTGIDAQGEKSCPSVVLLQCTNGHEQEDVGDVDLRSIYIVINGFAGMTEEEQEKLHDLTVPQDPSADNKSKFMDRFLKFSQSFTISNNVTPTRTQEMFSSYFDRTAELQYKTEAPSKKSAADLVRCRFAPNSEWIKTDFPERGDHRGHFFVLECEDEVGKQSQGLQTSQNND